MEGYNIEAKIKKLPEHIISEINDFVDFLLYKYGTKEIDKNKFNFSWEGKLFEVGKKYTSVELQHKSSEWR